MGYETQIQFNDVFLRPHVVPEFIAAAKQLRKNAKSDWAWMLDHIRIDAGDVGYLDWNMDKKARQEVRWNCDQPTVALSQKQLADLGSVRVAFWSDGDMMPAGKWAWVGDLVQWLAPFCESGCIVQVGQEGDGAISGWQIDGRKGFRELGMVPTTKWFRPVLKRRSKPAKKRKR